MNQGFNFRPNRPNNNQFWGPFLLGGITGGLISPIFYNRPYYQYPYYQYPYYYNYGPYYYR